MAEVVTSIAKEIVAFLGSRAIETIGKIRGVKREFELLKDTVSTLQPVLEHAEEQYDQSLQIKDWVDTLKDAFYDAHDVYEEFDIEAKRRELRVHNEIMNEVRTFFSSSNQLAFKLKMSDKVIAVRERLEGLIKDSKKFHLEERPVDSRVEQRRKREETCSAVCEGDIKGRDDDKQRVMKFLLDSNVQEHVSVLTIIGKEGIGKTALAQYVYNDEIVDKQFDLKMWVFVPDDFDVKQIVKNLIACATKKEPIDGALERLQSELRAEIKGKRYLLVLDYVCNIEQEKWRSLTTLLARGARGSKILITTQSNAVAKITRAASSFDLWGLSEDASCDLLMQMAGRTIEEMQDSDMIEIVREIVRKCHGVPSVIRSVGDLLFKITKAEWLQFNENELKQESQEEIIMSVLKLSYDNLPSHLKQCFALCSLFPKDCEIKKETLVNLWLAEGFIQSPDGSRHLEDIAHEYFVDLLFSGFFQDYQKDKDTCKMHGLMHDLASSVAGIECQVAWDDTRSIHERTHHISMFNLPISRLKANSLRTFLLAMPHETSEADLHHLIKSFKRLHVLDLHSTYVKKVPRSIGKLKYLTYLDFSDNDKLKRLPNSITRLQNLQTLNLRGCRSLEELPRDIRKLVSLRNLDINGCLNLDYVPRGIRQLTSLHRLTRFILPKHKAFAKKCCKLGELKGLNHIRGSLCIENLESVTDAIAEFKDANLKGKESIETLKLQWGNLNIGDAKAPLDELRPHSKLQKLTILGYKGESFPKWITALPNLVELCLWYCRCKDLPQLGRLSSLVDLSIKHCEELDLSKDESGNIISDFHVELKSLRSVKFDKLPKLASLPRWIPQASNLESLQIWDCVNLVELPEQIGALQSLQRLDIKGCCSLMSLPEALLRLASLTDLRIWDCEELDLSEYESGNIFWGFHDGLNSLRSVELRYLPKLASLPWWLLRANNLQDLQISDCDNLKELPEQIDALQSLQRLEINNCCSLTSLPEGILRLAFLTHLKIEGCPELEERCKRDAGEDWHKIAHIPYISLGQY